VEFFDTALLESLLNLIDAFAQNVSRWVTWIAMQVVEKVISSAL
jgi:hypothetical protein